MQIKNRKAFFDYEILEKYEAGISLEGWEVKSILAGQISLQESFVEITKGEAVLSGAHITPLKQASSHYEIIPTRKRTLLLHKYEIAKLSSKVAEKGLTIVPLAMYLKNNRVKIEIGLARGKNSVDKRHALKEKAIRSDEAKVAKSLKF